MRGADRALTAGMPDAKYAQAKGEVSDARAGLGRPERTAADAAVTAKHRSGGHRRVPHARGQMPDARAGLGRPEQAAADAAVTAKQASGGHRRVPPARAGRRLALAGGRGAPGGRSPTGLGAPGVTPRTDTASGPPGRTASNGREESPARARP